MSNLWRPATDEVILKHNLSGETIAGIAISIVLVVIGIIIIDFFFSSSKETEINRLGIEVFQVTVRENE